MRDTKDINMRTAYIVGVSSFVLKGMFALTINYWVATNFDPAEFAVWSVVFSIGMVLSIADLGVGQYVLTLLSDERLEEVDRTKVFSNAFYVICVVAAVFLLFALFYVAIVGTGYGGAYSYSLVGLMVMRVVTIPHGAFLQSVGRYHERKLFESLGYGGAFFYLFFREGENPEIQEVMLVINGFITIAALALGLRAYSLKCPTIVREKVNILEIHSIIKNSFPYFLNNSSGLLIYGGFITISSFLLPVSDVAKLALFHSMIFTNIYQVYELCLRIAQSKIKNNIFFVKISILFFLSLVALTVVIVFGGHYFSGQLFSEYSVSLEEISVLSAYMFLELAYLLLISRSQMILGERGIIAKVASWKTVSFIGVVVALYWLGQVSLSVYAICLGVWSAVSLIVFCVSLWRWAMDRHDVPTQGVQRW